jgi:spore coat protein A, manganese oxidase
MKTRREFLKTAAIAGAGVAAYGLLRPNTARAFYQTPTNTTRLWATALRGPADIPTIVTPATGSTLQKINLTIQQFTDSIHPSLGPTMLWGYHPDGFATPAHLGGIIVAHKNQPIQLTLTNGLPSQHILPVDTSILGAEGPQNRAAVHGHGGFVS